MVLHNTQLRYYFRDRVIVIFLCLLFSQPILCGLVKSCVPRPAKASARSVSAIAASLRSPKMKPKIIAAMFSRLFLKTTTTKNLRYSVLCMPSADYLQSLNFYPLPGVLNVNSILWYRNLGYKSFMGVFNSRFALNHEEITS